MPYKDEEKQKEYLTKHYLDNKQRYLDSQIKNRERARSYVWEKKVKGECCKCGEGHPAVLDFHHRDPSKKEVTASRMVTNRCSNKTIDAELKKCDILCANCHRIFHHNEKENKK